MKFSETGNRVNMLLDTVKNRKGGVALIFVVWVMIVLMGIVAEFSYSMRTEINIVRNFKEEEEAYQLALSGIEAAKAEILSAEDSSGMYVNENNVLVFDSEEEEPDRKGTLGDGTFEYRINDEDGKLNINSVSRAQLGYILVESGVDIMDVDTITDSVIDWRDENDLHMLNGAEEDYYRSLKPPYSCKDGPFDSVEELLLVKGMTPEIFYGSGEETEDDDGDGKAYSGVLGYLTAMGTDMINVNTAPGVVLEAVMGIEAARRIIQAREAGLQSGAVRGSKTVSSFFTVISTGTSGGGAAERTIKTILYKKNDSLETVYWNDNFIG